MDPCMVCEYAHHLSPQAIEKALDKRREKYGIDDDWDYWDECCFREMQYCHPCPYEYAREGENMKRMTKLLGDVSYDESDVRDVQEIQAAIPLLYFATPLQIADCWAQYSRASDASWFVVTEETLSGFRDWLDEEIET